MNEKGQIFMFPVKLIMFFLAIVIMIALLAPIKEQVEYAQGSNNLNCPGYISYVEGGIAEGNYTYNSSIASYPMACTMVKLYPLWIVLAVMMIGVLLLIGGGGTGGVPQQPQYGYGGYG